MEVQKPRFEWYKCKEDDLQSEKMLLKKLLALGETQ